MANIPLQSDQVTWMELDDYDASGNVVPFPSGDVDTVATTGTFAASLVVSMDTMPSGAANPGATAVKFVPQVLKSDPSNGGGGIGVSITDSAGQAMNAATQGMLFDIVENVTPQMVGLDPAKTFTQPQSAPTAVGP